MKTIDYVRQGLPLNDILLIDLHCHLGQGKEFYIPYCDLNEQFQNFRHTLNRVAVDFACVSMFRALFHGDVEANFMLQDFMEVDRRILGWIVYNPFIINESLSTIQKCREATRRYVGIKIHPVFHQTRLSDDSYRPAFEYADAEGLPLLIHTWQTEFSAPVQLRDIVKKYRNAKFLLAHCGGVQPGVKEAVNLASNNDNVFLDLTGGFIYSGMRLEDYVKGAGVHKLLFSSDTVYNNICWEIGNIAFSELPEESKRAILGSNAKKLLCIR